MVSLAGGIIPFSLLLSNDPNASHKPTVRPPAAVKHARVESFNVVLTVHNLRQLRLVSVALPTHCAHRLIHRVPLGRSIEGLQLEL